LAVAADKAAMQVSSIRMAFLLVWRLTFGI
jgi:hypothetical protein